MAVATSGSQIGVSARIPQSHLIEHNRFKCTNWYAFNKSLATAQDTCNCLRVNTVAVRGFRTEVC
eukprot:scaffold167150_cov21-Tisochrysis_lutea.AAC.1